MVGRPARRHFGGPGPVAAQHRGQGHHPRHDLRRGDLLHRGPGADRENGGAADRRTVIRPFVPITRSHKKTGPIDAGPVSSSCRPKEGGEAPSPITWERYPKVSMPARRNRPAMASAPGAHTKGR